MPTLNVLKNGMVSVHSTMSSSIHEMSSIFAQLQLQKQVNYFLNKEFFLKNNEKQWKKQHWTLAYILVLQTMSFPLSSIIWFGPIEFPSKMVPCKCHFSLVLDPNLKALGPIYGKFNQ
jgi:hypothetical protein